MQLLRTLAIIFILFYGFKLLMRYVFPFLLKRWVNKKMGQFQHGNHNSFSDQEKEQKFAKQREGEVKIKSKQKTSKPTSDGVGDFVDYEEVD